MKYLLRGFLLVCLLLLLTTQLVAAQDGYQIVTTAPESGMLPLNTSCAGTVYDAANGMRATSVTITIDAYVIWVRPQRPADYYVGFYVNGVRFWTIYSRQTFDAICSVRPLKVAFAD